MFQEKMVNSANEWMLDQQKAFCQQAMSVQMLKGRMWGWNNPLPMGQSAQSCPGVVENRLV